MKNSFNLSLPPMFIIFSYFSDHASIVVDLTNDIWTPKLLCTPLHVKHKNIAFGKLAHVGLGAPHSKHYLLSG